MCIHAVRLCPGCGAATDFRDLDTCDQALHCPETRSYELPLRREHFQKWDCPTSECAFNNTHLRDVEREYLLARLAQKGGDPEALIPPLTADELALLMTIDETAPVPHLRVHVPPDTAHGSSSAQVANVTNHSNDGLDI
ncbi:89e2c95d-31a4-4ea1-9ee4-dbad324a01fe [Thermothielavioides terrestris]|uniref:89e2c95d-31a4-4ea1-9ee4-dbad324a01fe n=1 Tax=Thermothielavioides terrestris TaxID=2587410 RepID=A0A3S4C9G4_9PEZI|nr:89e2c95d-31a4-4ea1-9ee4-dbad324a01fe [Thermothielavioides terrestris]